MFSFLNIVFSKNYKELNVSTREEISKITLAKNTNKSNKIHKNTACQVYGTCYQPYLIFKTKFTYL